MQDLYEASQQLVEGGIRKAEEIGVRVSIALVDSHGDVIAVKRMSGAISLSPKIAMGKGSAAAIFRRATSEFEPRILQNPTMWSGVTSMTAGALLFGRGGVPIIDGSETLGAIGVSGATSEQDELIAKAAAAEWAK